MRIVCSFNGFEDSMHNSAKSQTSHSGRCPESNDQLFVVCADRCSKIVSSNDYDYMAKCQGKDNAGLG